MFAVGVLSNNECYPSNYRILNRIMITNIRLFKDFYVFKGFVTLFSNYKFSILIYIVIKIVKKKNQ